MVETLPPLPVAGPTTRTRVVNRFKLKNLTEADLVDLDDIVAAVNDYVRDLPAASKARGSESWPANIVTGSTMLAGRIWRRKDTPGGVYTVGGDVPIFVHRQDPDVALLLGLGDYGKPDAG